VASAVLEAGESVGSASAAPSSGFSRGPSLAVAGGGVSPASAEVKPPFAVFMGSRISAIGSSRDAVSPRRKPARRPGPATMTRPVDAPDLPDGIWQLLGPQHDEGNEQDDHQLTTRHVEHAASLRSGRRQQMALAKRAFDTVPDVQQRLPSLLDPPIAFAHRGARAHAPENTIEAFRLALRLGATGL